MTIVEWLRKEAELVALDRLNEAADEIERLRAAIMALRDAYDTAETEVVRLRTAMHDIAIGGNGEHNWTLDEVRAVAWDALDVAPDVAPGKPPPLNI